MKKTLLLLGLMCSLSFLNIASADYHSDDQYSDDQEHVMSQDDAGNDQHDNGHDNGSDESANGSSENGDHGHNDETVDYD